MFQSLKRKHFIKSFFAALFFFAVAVVIFVGSKSMDTIKTLLTKPVNFNELAAADVKKGVRVSAEINLIYDYYCHYEEDGVMTSKEYLIPVGDKEYMGLVCDGSDMKEADAVMQFYWDYVDGKEVSADSIQTMKITGTIMPLEGEELRLYNQYIDGIDWPEKAKKNFLPYAVMVGKIGSDSVGTLIMFGVVMLGMFVTGVGFLLSGIKGSNLKEVEKYCREQGNKEMYMQRLEEFYDSGIPVQGIRINTQYFMAVAGSSCYFAEAKDVLWIYKNIVQHKVNGIPTGKTYALIIKKTNGKEFNVAMKNEAAADEAIEYVAQNMPYVILGYDDELAKIYAKERTEMMYEVEKRRQEYLSMSEDGSSFAGGYDMPD